MNSSKIYLIVFDMPALEADKLIQEIQGNYISKRISNVSFLIISDELPNIILNKIRRGIIAERKIIIAEVSGNWFASLPTVIWDWIKEKTGKDFVHQ